LGDDHTLKQKSQGVTLFKFELNQSQSIIILIFALTGLFLTPISLAGEVIINLFQNLFVLLPSYLSQPHSEFIPKSYLLDIFAPNITHIIILSFFLYLSFITVRKLIQGLGGEGTQKPKIIPQDRIVRWFGLKLSHGQAIFIFSLSVIGIPFLILELITIKTTESFILLYYLEEFWYIPIGPGFGLTGQYSNGIILDYAPIILYGLFFIMCLYSIFASRRRKKSHSNHLKTASNYSILIFIVSFIVFILFLTRLFSHLFNFTDLAYLIGATPYPTNSYQFNDFLNVVIILIISSAFLVFSYFLKKRPKNIQKQKKILTWFRVTLTKNRYIMLLSFAIMYSCLQSFTFAAQFFTFEIEFLSIDEVILYIIFFLIILYSYIKIYNEDAFHRILDQFNDSDVFTVKWLNFKVNRLQSIILCSLSSGAIIYYVLYMQSLRGALNGSGFFPMISILIILSLLLLFAVYTIKCTFKGVISR